MGNINVSIVTNVSLWCRKLIVRKTVHYENSVIPFNFRMNLKTVLEIKFLESLKFTKKNKTKQKTLLTRFNLT